LLEQLLSKEVADVSALMPQSVEELKKVIEDHQKEIKALRKENEDKDRRIKELEALLASKQ